MFTWYMYLIVNLFFPPLFLEWESFLVAPFPDLCLIVPFSIFSPRSNIQSKCTIAGVVYWGAQRDVDRLVSEQKLR